MTLKPDEFMRRFVLHVLPGGFHRIRHYGLLANARRKEKLVRVRELMGKQVSITDAPGTVVPELLAQATPTFVCSHYGGCASSRPSFAGGPFEQHRRLRYEC